MKIRNEKIWRTIQYWSTDLLDYWLAG